VKPGLAFHAATFFAAPLRSASDFGFLAREPNACSNRRYGEALVNPLKPELMTAEERLAELCQILTAGLMRLHARKSSELSRDHGESSVDFGLVESGHADRTKRRTA